MSKRAIEQPETGGGGGGGGADDIDEFQFADHEVTDEAPKQSKKAKATAAAPVAPKKKSGGGAHDGGMICLSLMQTMNLLEPDTRILTFDEGYAAEEDPAADKKVKETIIKPWVERIKPFVKLYMHKTDGVADGEAEADEEEEEGGGGGGEDGGEEEDGAPAAVVGTAQPAYTYTEEPLVALHPFSEGVVHPDSITVAHHQTKYGSIPKTAMLFSNTARMVSKKRDIAAQSRLFGRAMQRIGHRVLLGNHDIIGGYVTYPGVCDADMEPEKVEPTPNGGLDASKISTIDRVLLDSAAAVYTAWSFHVDTHVSRLTKVELVRITLAQYIAAVRHELLGAQNMDVSAKKNTIIKTIESQLAIAESYVKGVQPATDYILPPGKVDPEKVMLELYMHRLINSEELNKSNLFDGILVADSPGSKFKYGADKIKAIMKTLAAKDNTATIIFRFGFVSGDSRDTTGSIARFQIMVTVPIIPFSRYYKECVSGEYKSIMLPIVKAVQARAHLPAKSSVGAATSTAETQKKVVVVAAKTADEEEPPAAADEEDGIEEEAEPPKKTGAKTKPTPSKEKAPVADDDGDADADDKLLKKPSEMIDAAPKKKANLLPLIKKSAPPPPPPAEDDDPEEDGEPPAKKVKAEPVPTSKKKAAPPPQEEEEEKAAPVLEMKKQPTTPKPIVGQKQPTTPKPVVSPKPITGQKRPREPATVETECVVRFPLSERDAAAEHLLSYVVSSVPIFNKPSLKPKVRYGTFAAYKAGDESSDTNLRTSISTVVSFLNYTGLQALPQLVQQAEASLRAPQKNGAASDEDEEESVDAIDLLP